MKRMRSQIKSQKSQDKLYFCKMCSYVTETQEELDLHYETVHEEQDDINYELETIFANKKNKQK